MGTCMAKKRAAIRSTGASSAIQTREKKEARKTEIRAVMLVIVPGAAFMFCTADSFELGFSQQKTRA